MLNDYVVGNHCITVWEKFVKTCGCASDTRARPAPAPSRVDPCDDCNDRCIDGCAMCSDNPHPRETSKEYNARKAAQQPRPPTTDAQKRKVITLCGSVKFWKEYLKWNAILTLQGNVVFSCGLSMKSGYEDILLKYSVWELNDVKKDLDEIHLRKIDLSDEIFVLNVGGYIGDSTKREIAYAESRGKSVRYLEATISQQQGGKQI